MSRPLRASHGARLPGLVLGVAGLLLPAVAAGLTPAAAATPAYHPTRLAHLGDSRQVIVVTAANWSTSYATLRAYRKTAGGWVLQRGATGARIGWNGFAGFGARYQNSGETPAGTFRLLRAFGSQPDPGTRLPWRTFDRNDWWPYDPRDPRTYNVTQLHGRSSATRWRSSWAEHLWDFRDQYAYAVILDYNLPHRIYRSGTQRFARSTADTRRGGGIFLHVKKAKPTAGCVAVSGTAMVSLVRWLDPAEHPVIVMAPDSAIGRA